MLKKVNNKYLRLINFNWLLLLTILVIGTTTLGLGSYIYSQTKQLIVPSNKCDASLWKHIHSPRRLQVINKCIEVTGVVVFARQDRDGDIHLRLKLDKKFEKLLNSRNLTAEKGTLILELICEFKATQSDAINTCIQYNGDLEYPPVGSEVKVVGSYVLDKLHGWNEIHPVSSIKKYP